MALRHRRRGYTLVEVTLVLALMVIMGAVAYPSIEAMSAGVKVEGASDSVRAAWSEAQAHAVNEGRPYRFAVVPGKGNYRIAPDSDSYFSGSPPARSGPDDQTVVVSGLLPKGMVFPNADGTVPSVGGNEDTQLPEDGIGQGQWATVAVFLPDGTAQNGDRTQDDVDVLLQMPGVQSRVVHLRALTGVVTVERGD